MTHPADVYEAQAAAYFAATAHVDPGPFLQPLEKRLTPGSRVLDVGCGSGRDLLWFAGRGHQAVGLERSPKLARMAGELSGCPVFQGDFWTWDFSQEQVEAVLLVGALVHEARAAARQALIRILPALHVRGRVLLTLKQGQGLQETADGRVFVLWQEEEVRDLLHSTGLNVLEVFRRTSPVRAGDLWLGAVARLGADRV